MPEEIQNEKPCLVNTPQGFSVSYKNKFLYSKYAPQKAILANIEKLSILPGTLFLCCSPVLSYGLKELCSKLNDKSFCLLCEFDDELREFEKTQLPSEFIQLTKDELFNLPSILNLSSYTTKSGKLLPPAGTFRRVVRIDFSAGIQLHPSLYEELTAACTNAIMTFWANRMTLVKFGRKYSQNFFRNLKVMAETTPIQKYFGAITKPVIVFGAGESQEEGIKFLKGSDSSAFYILCADTALQPLLANGIEPDGVFIEEAQSVIKKAFIGTQNSRTQIFAGLSAIPHLNRIKLPAKLSFFMTKYAEGKFFENLKEKGLIPNSNEPFGSVGLTTVYYALKFRASPQVPVYIYGLDFSYSKGRTHAKDTLAHKERLLKSTKLFPVANYTACFNQNAEQIKGKNETIFYTTRTLKNYATLFNGLFAKIPNLFDAGTTGLELGLIHKQPELSSKSESKNNLEQTSFTPVQCKAIDEYFKSEKAALEELRDLLTGKIKLPENELKTRITEIASPREYLYLHFPDGIRFSTDLSFLKRIRTEIDFFLKYL